MSAIIPGNLPLAYFGDPILLIQLLDDDTIGVLPEFDDAIPQLMTEAAYFSGHLTPNPMKKHVLKDYQFNR